MMPALVTYVVVVAGLLVAAVPAARLDHAARVRRWRRAQLRSFMARRALLELNTRGRRGCPR
jgi:hypothetical protein